MLFGAEFVDGFFIAVEGFHFFGDDGEFFEFIGGLNGTAEEFPEALEEELGVGIAEDGAVIVVVGFVKHFDGASFDVVLTNAIDLVKVCFVEPAQCCFSYFDPKTGGRLGGNEFDDFVVGVIAQPFKELRTLFGRNFFGKNSRGLFSCDWLTINNLE